MKIIHTSDWHLGRTLHGVDLSDAHRLFIDGLIDKARHVQPDALLMTGDFFDRSVPNTAAVELGRYALEKLCDVCPVILSPGNHDSDTRLGWLSGFLSKRLIIRTDVRNLDKPVYVLSRDGKEPPAVIDAAQARTYYEAGRQVGVIYPLPYMHPNTSCVTLADMTGKDTIERSHQAVISAAMDLIADNYKKEVLSFAPTGLPTVVGAHVFVTGGQESTSERTIEVGGIADVKAGTFDRRVGGECFVDYVALGHLHRPQILSDKGGPPMAYCGSPVAFSFSEAGYKKTQLIVEVTHGKPPSITPFDVPVYRNIYTITDSFDNLTQANYPEESEGWVSITLTDNALPPHGYGILRQEFPYLLKFTMTPSAGADASLDVHKRDAMSTKDIITEFLTTVGGLDLGDEERRIVDQVDEEVRQTMEGAEA